MASNASLDDVVAHWCILIENLQASPLQFYQSVEAALDRRQIPEAEADSVDYKESGVLSARREYLRVRREKLVFDICGAPFGTGFFVSWWLVEEKPNLDAVLKLTGIAALLALVYQMVIQFGIFQGAIAVCVVVALGLWLLNAMATGSKFNDDYIRVLPIIGPLYNWLFKATTYYRIDTMLMFREAVRQAVLEVIDEMTTAKGLRALTESERKPIMREFYQRKAA